MRIVVDTNVLFSALLRMPNLYATTIFLGEHSFYSPKFVFIELFKHKEKITKHTKLTEDEVLELLHRLLKRIRISEENQISEDSLYQAYELYKNIDLKEAIRQAVQSALGKKVDLCREKYIKPYFKKQILDSVIYV